MSFEEKTIASKTIYKGKILHLEQQTVLLPDGKEAAREIVRHPGAAAVIPMTENGELYMVRQYRKPIEAELLEIPAGKLDPGEDPAHCAERELREETGLTAKSLRHMVSIHSTPGFSDEVLHLYLATGLSEGEAHSDEDEFLSCVRVPIQKLVEQVLSHEITDAKTIIGILLAERSL